jgi:hypothetical protein
VQTVAELLAARIEAFRELLRTFLVEQPGEIRDTRSDWEAAGIAFAGPTGRWPPLDDEGKRIQARLLSEHDRLSALMDALLWPLTAGDARKLDGATKKLGRLIEQRSTGAETRADAFQSASAALDQQLGLIHQRHDPAEGDPLFVPDTNARLWNTDLDAWRFSGAPRFGLVILPTVLHELDRLKVEHRNEAVREKAEGLIRRMKDYRSRGRLAEGVTLSRDVSRIMTMAVEADAEHALPWLDLSNDDDRILAAFVDVMRQHPRTPVVLVTRDNLQNKAEYAELPFVEPPDPPAPDAPRT